MTLKEKYQIKPVQKPKAKNINTEYPEMFRPIDECSWFFMLNNS